MKLNGIAEFSEFMDAHDFRFAKTMPEEPHWYTLREGWEDQEAFDACVRFIREEGVTEYYRRRPYIKIRCGEYKYWTMGEPVSETILINRAKACG
tara:strand:- start:319 stop:603 length:285 start_codon:yes stop_codon:yes gene_type:complete